MPDDTPIRSVEALIRARRDQFGNAEKRIADFITENPEAITSMGLVKLAEGTSVSQPTVVRFCRKLGFDGFSDFKLRYAQGLVTHRQIMHENVELSDDTPSVIRKITDSAMLALRDVRDGLDPTQIDEAADLMCSSRRVECYGNGGAHVVAVEAQNKLYRLGIPAVLTADFFTQVITAGTMVEGDIILAISFNGLSKNLCEVVKVAETNGNRVVAITAPDSPLSNAASLSIGVAVAEDFISYAPMSAPVAFIAAVDILAMSISMRQPPEVQERHARGKDALNRLNTFD